MFDIGFAELFVIFTIALLVLGPEKLPSAARAVGKNLGKAKRFFNNMQRQIDQEIRLEELNKKIMSQMDETQQFIKEQKAIIAEKEAIEQQDNNILGEQAPVSPSNSIQPDSKK
jgi:sec-independent protein translocase protein TatB